MPAWTTDSPYRVISAAHLCTTEPLVQRALDAAADDLRQRDADLHLWRSIASEALAHAVTLRAEVARLRDRHRSIHHTEAAA